VTRRRACGLALLAIIGSTAVAAPVLAPNPPARQHEGMAFAPPMWPRVVHDGAPSWPFVYPLVLVDRLERRFAEDVSRPAPIRLFSQGRVLSVEEHPWLPLGGDPLGRDVFARLLAGGRLSLAAAGAAVLLTLLIGASAGALAGFAGGRVDRVIVGLADFVVVLPMVYAVVTLRAAMPLVMDNVAVFWTLVGVMALATWPLPARGVRAIVAVERRKAYAEAAYALGAGPLRILLRHVLPAAGGHMATQGLLLFPAFIFAEATLSFLGLGFAEPVSSWGVMLQDAARVSAMVEAPWLLVPAAAIVLTVLAVHLVTAGHRGTDRAAGWWRT